MVYNKSKDRELLYCDVTLCFLERTVFTVKPEKNIYVKLPDPVTFTVKAKSDPDTPITYSWYHHGEQCGHKGCTVDDVAEKTQVITRDDYSSLTILRTEASDLGIYRCVASNGISQDSLEVNLLAAPDSRTTSSTTQPPTSGNNSNINIGLRGSSHKYVTKWHHSVSFQNVKN